MDTDGKYNGWTNYETWAVKLWLDNEEPIYRFWQKNADRAWADSGDDDNVERGLWTREQAAVYALAKILKEAHENDTPTAVNGTVYADLLQAALDSVNWDEIAASLIEDVDKDDDES